MAHSVGRSKWSSLITIGNNTSLVCVLVIAVVVLLLYKLWLCKLQDICVLHVIVQRATCSMQHACSSMTTTTSRPLVSLCGWVSFVYYAFLFVCDRINCVLLLLLAYSDCLWWRRVPVNYRVHTSAHFWHSIRIITSSRYGHVCVSVWVGRF